MKKLIAILFMLVACSSPKEKNVSFHLLDVDEDEWAVYEGKIITDAGLEADVELSLLQTAVGIDSYFKLIKNIPMKSGYNSNSNGKYSVSYGLPQQEQGITIFDPPIKFDRKKIDNTIKGSQLELLKKYTKDLEKIQDELATPELYFKTKGNEKLIQTDRGFEWKGPKFVLYKRSNLFTVEGYVTFEDSVTEFYERNTRKNWRVSSLGVIDSIKMKYIELATEMNEGIYLKALAYSIADTTSQSNESLVIKRLLRMEKSSMKNPIK